MCETGVLGRAVCSPKADSSGGGEVRGLLQDGGEAVQPASAIRAIGVPQAISDTADVPLAVAATAGVPQAVGTTTAVAPLWRRRLRKRAASGVHGASRAGRGTASLLLRASAAACVLSGAGSAWSLLAPRSHTVACAVAALLAVLQENKQLQRKAALGMIERGGRALCTEIVGSIVVLVVVVVAV